MQDPTTATAVKSAATAGTAAAAAFGLTGWAIAAALVGAAASLHFEEEAKASTIWRLLGAITAQGFIAAMLAAAAPSIPLFAWTEAVPVAVRAGLLGVLANPLYQRIRAIMQRFQGGT